MSSTYPYDRPLLVPPPDLPPLFVEPPAAAREHWKLLRARLERLDRVRAQQHELEVEIIRLREEIPPAKHRDGQRLGRALAAGELEPQQETPRLEAQLVKARRDSLALNSAISTEITKATRLVERRRPAWSEDLRRHLVSSAARYRTVVEAMAEAREQLVTEVQVGAWLEQFPQGGPQPATEHVPPHPQLDERPRMFTQVLGDLLRDSEQLPAAAPALAGDPFRLRGGQVILEAVDELGPGRPRVFLPDTPENRVRRTLDRIDAEREAKAAKGG
jgi:hypothetical protein